MPVQRIPRYILLISDLSKRTPPEHPDHVGLKKALVKVSEIADWTDEQKTIYDRGQELVKLSDSIFGLPKGLTIVAPGRSLKKESDMDLTGTSHHFFLFNDMLLITKKFDDPKKKKKKDEPPAPQKFNYINHVEMKTAAVMDYPENQTYKNAFSVSSGGHSLLVMATSPIEKTQWLAELNKIVDTVQKPPQPKA